MIVDLSSIAGPDFEFAFEVGVGDVDFGDEPLSLGGPIRVSGSLSKGADRLKIEGHVEGPLVFDCSRCLAPVERSAEFKFSDSFVTPDKMARTEEGEVPGEALDEDALLGDEIDLTDLVREQLILRVPDQILCSESCRGLCDRCGADLNKGECGCSREEADPRWQALESLKGSK